MKPTKEFVRLFEKSEKYKEEVLEIIGEATGYNAEWVKKNFDKAAQALPEDKRAEIEHKFLKAQITKQKLWADYYFTNFEKIKDYLLKPSRIEYNPKTKKIELIDGAAILEKMKKSINDFKKHITKLTEQKPDNNSINL